jgi:hypothetical protein
MAVNETALVKKLEKEISLIVEECRVRGRGIKAIQQRSLRRLESATADLEMINPGHPDVEIFDEILESLEEGMPFDREAFAETKAAQSEDLQMTKQLKKHIADFKKADNAREKAIRRVIEIMRDYKLKG